MGWAKIDLYSKKNCILGGVEKGVIASGNLLVLLEFFWISSFSRGLARSLQYYMLKENKTLFSYFL